MTVRATFTFRNQGGAPATGVRVRFNLPDGLVYLVGTGQLDGANLDDEQGNSPLLSRSGAHIGDVDAGEERRIEISYSVAGAIENGTMIELQAAVASFEVPPVGSNIIRLIARSRPQLREHADRDHDRGPLGAGPRGRGPDHGPPAQRRRVERPRRGRGGPDSRAHALRAELGPGQRPRDRTRPGSPFDRVHAPIVTPALAASATSTLVYRVRDRLALARRHGDRRARACRVARDAPRLRSRPRLAGRPLDARLQRRSHDLLGRAVATTCVQASASRGALRV